MTESRFLDSDRVPGFPHDRPHRGATVGGTVGATHASPLHHRPHRGLLFAIGLPTGLVAGLFGVGGGIVAVPAQRALGIRMARAVANSTAVILPVSLVGAGVKLVLGSRSGVFDVADPLRLAAILGPAAALGAWFGARAVGRIPDATLRGAFAVVLLATAVRLWVL